MPTAARSVRDELKTCLASTAGAEYNELKYLEEASLSKNSFTQGKDKRYGVRPGSTPESAEAGVNRDLTYTQSFEFVLTKGYKQSAHSDSAKYEAFLDLHEIALQFYNKVYKAPPSRALNVVDLIIEEPLFVADDKVAVLTGNVNIIYRLTL